MSTGVSEPGDAHERFVDCSLRLAKLVAFAIAPGCVAGLIAGGVGSYCDESYGRLPKLRSRKPKRISGQPWEKSVRAEPSSCSWPGA